MAPVTLPPSFYNSFWSPDYRTGLDVLFRQLEKGCIENQDIAAFIESQARAHHNLSASLLEPPLGANRSTSSLQHTLLSLKAASSARGEAHRALAVELEEHVLLPFNGWRGRHEDRIEAARDALLGRNGVVAAWEKEVHRLMGLRQSYLVKTRTADDSEDDAKFAPTTAAQVAAESYTQAPPIIKPPGAALRRAGTVADRISEKLRAASLHQRSGSMDSNKSGSNKFASPVDSPTRPSAINVKAPPNPANNAPDSPSSPTQEDAFIPPTDPNGLPMISGDGPPTPAKDGEKEVPELPVLLSGLSMPQRDFKGLLHRFDQYLQTHAALGSGLQGELSSRTVLASRQRSTILGTYEKTFSGIEAVEWIRKNVSGFNGEWDRCMDAATELQRMGHLSRIGVGRGFEPTDDTFYVLKVNPAEGTALATIQHSLKDINISSPTSNYASIIKNYLPASLNTSDEPVHIRLRREADKANEAYKLGVEESEAKRLDMEEKIERGLRVWEKWERERLGVVNSVLKHYEQAIGKLPKRLAHLQESTELSVEAFNPEADLKALIEGSRTGPFRPRPHIYESMESEAPEVNFGIDLRRWSGETAWKQMVNAPERPKDAIPDVLSSLLQAFTEMGAALDPVERRKSWIYEVPLQETHMLRNSINSAQLTAEDMVTIAKKFNVPIVAAVVKLWLLELNPPVLGWEGWEDAKAVYPSVGADQERDMTSAVTSVLSRLPASHLFTLNAIVKFWKDLIVSTKTAEDDDNVYITKLSLSAGRCLLRPQYETELTIQDRTPGLFLVDLLEHYDDVFPAVIEKKKAQQDRIMPVRKRTALVDQRISRTSISQSGDVNPQALLAEQARTLAPSPRPQEQPVPAQVPVPVPAPAPAPAAAPAAAPPPVATSAPQQTINVTPATPIPSQSQAPAAAPVPAPPANRSPSKSSATLPSRNAADSDEDEPPFEPPFEPPTESTQSPPSRPAIPPLSTGAPLSRTMSPAATSSAGRASPGSPSSITSPAHASRPSLGDEVVGGTTGSLRRNLSNEASRLRGPKGARGPRAMGTPANTGHVSRGSVSAIAAQFESK